MGHTLVKPSPDADMYVIWSTVTDCPIFYGDRAETFQELGGYIPPGRPCDTCGHWVSERDTPSSRLRAADAHGSDTRHYGWDKTEFFYRQAGMLARADLTKAVDLLAAGRDELVLDLLTPYEDEPGLLDDARRRYREATRPVT